MTRKLTPDEEAAYAELAAAAAKLREAQRRAAKDRRTKLRQRTAREARP